MAAQVLRCEVCGANFIAARSDRRTCSDAHRQQLSRATRVDEFGPLREIALQLRRDGVISGEEALLYVVAPTRAIIEALNARERVAA